MVEPRYEHEDRYIQQGGVRRPLWDERRSPRGFQPLEDRYEASFDRSRHSNRENFGRFPDSDRRYTAPNDEPYENELERTGTPRFSERRSGEYDRSFDHEPSYGSRGSARMYRPQEAYSPFQNHGARDFAQSGTLGHAEWNIQPDWNRGPGFSDPYSDHSAFNQQKHRWPKGFKRSDERLMDDIHEALIRNSHIDSSELEVQVKDGEATLTGTVNTRSEKRLAEEAAENVLGVHEVQNNLRVRVKSLNPSEKSGASSSANRMSVAGQTENPPNTSGNRAANASNK